MNRALLSVCAVGGLTAAASAVVPTEDFAITPPTGWVQSNQSNPLGGGNWFQGNATVFPSQAGAPNAYAGCNYQSGTGTSTLSNWLITPQYSLAAGELVDFWTRTTTGTFPDRLQVWYNPLGTTNTGTSETDVGDFSVLLLDINPTYTNAGYPTVWTEFTAAIPTSSASGRIAFRYFVEDGGPAGDNSDYIGIDTFSVTPAPGATALLGLGGLAVARRRRRV